MNSQQKIPTNQLRHNKKRNQSVGETRKTRASGLRRSFMCSFPLQPAVWYLKEHFANFETDTCHPSVCAFSLSVAYLQRSPSPYLMSYISLCPLSLRGSSLPSTHRFLLPDYPTGSNLNQLTVFCFDCWRFVVLPVCIMCPQLGVNSKMNQTEQKVSTEMNEHHPAGYKRVLFTMWAVMCISSTVCLLCF